MHAFLCCLAFLGGSFRSLGPELFLELCFSSGDGGTGQRGYKWLGTVLKASSRERLTHTFWKENENNNATRLVAFILKKPCMNFARIMKVCNRGLLGSKLDRRLRKQTRLDFNKVDFVLHTLWSSSTVYLGFITLSTRNTVMITSE